MQIHELNKRNVLEKRPPKPAPPPSYGKNTAMPTTPLTVPGAGTNAAPGQPTAQPASDSVAGKEPSTWDRVKGAVNSRQAGINQRYDTGQYEKSAAAGNKYQQQIQQQYNKLKPMATPGFDTKSPVTTSPTDSRGSNTIPAKVLQQAAKGTYITKTGDYETDQMLKTLGYRFK